MIDYSKKRSWEILYSDCSGVQKKAVELLYREMSALITRDPGIYTFHTLTVRKSCVLPEDKNAVVVGLYDRNELIRKYIKREEIPENGYVVKVMKNPERSGGSIVLITAGDEQSVFYGAVDFVDDYFSLYAYRRSPSLSIVFYDELFLNELPAYYSASAPAIRTRSIFTWGHPINDYRAYIDTMARMRYNQLIVWNDYAPVNAADVVSYAHEYGISLIWGFSWGWHRNCEEIDLEHLDALTDEILKKYEEEYAHTGADGIYFQSFTELKKEYIGGRLIAECVTDFVNKTAERLLQKHPSLLIQFGLHATSVKERLEFIRGVDERIDIIWEDCGEFPYSYEPFVKDVKDFEATEAFTDKIFTLRPNAHDGVLFKGCLTMDWVGDYFAHQSGPYIMGCENERTKARDREVIRPLWRNFQNGWLANGEYAYRMAKRIRELNGASVGVAGQLTGGHWFAPALIAQILWECDRPYEDIFKKVTARRIVEML